MSNTPLRTKNLIKGFEDGSIKDSEKKDGSDSWRESYTPPVTGQTKKMAKEFANGPQPPPEASASPTESIQVVRRISMEDQRMKPWTQSPVKHKVLIVFAHWERNSFNGALLDTAVAALTGQGHDVAVTDLYAQAFNPLPSRNDIQDGPRNPEKFNYAHEAGLAYGRGSLAPDVLEEQAKLAKADVVIFQFPLNWATVPAILKGYFDRVLVQKFAYNYGKWFDNGKFKGRKAILSVTTGSTESSYSTSGYLGDINVILWPLQNCVLRFCGWDVLSPNICFAPGMASEAERHAMLDIWKKRLSKDLWKEQPIQFIPIENFDLATGKLDDAFLKKLALSSDEDAEEPRTRLPIGQHFGGKVFPGSMYKPEVSREMQNEQNK